MRKHRKLPKSNVLRKKDEKPAKEVGIMSTTVSLRESEEVFVREMSHYVTTLKLQQQKSRYRAQEEAKSALIRTGVLTEEGEEKEKIVTWE